MPVQVRGVVDSRTLVAAPIVADQYNSFATLAGANQTVMEAGGWKGWAKLAGGDREGRWLSHPGRAGATSAGSSMDSWCAVVAGGRSLWRRFPRGARRGGPSGLRVRRRTELR